MIIIIVIITVIVIFMVTIIRLGLVHGYRNDRLRGGLFVLLDDRR
jgi:hypothetical protein